MSNVGGAEPRQSRAALRAVIATAICIQAAQGIFDVSLALRAESAGLSATDFGWTGATNALGFVLGALAAPLVLGRFGAYRVLAAACVLSAPVATLGWASSEDLWLLCRLGAGFGFALMFAATDTGVMDTAPPGARPRAIGVYVMFERIATMVMPFAFATRLAAPATLVDGVACLWLALLPGRVLRESHPPRRQTELKLWSNLEAAWHLAPPAVLCALAAGALNTSVLILLPRFVHGELGDWAVPVVQATAWAGALAVQLGASFLAPSWIRTRLGIWLCPVAAAALLSMPAAAAAGLGTATAAALLLGASAFSQHGLALMTLADRAAFRNHAVPAPALVFAWGAGAIAGPISCSALGFYAHPANLFVLLAASWLAVPTVNLARRRQVSAAAPLANSPTSGGSAG